jgi:hypothetical protein
VPLGYSLALQSENALDGHREGTPIHVRRRFDAEQTQRRGREIHDVRLLDVD